MIHTTQLGSENVSKTGKTIEIGQQVKAKIIKVDASNKKIALSIKAYEEKLDLKAIEQEQSQLETFKDGDEQTGESLSIETSKREQNLTETSDEDKKTTD